MAANLDSSDPVLKNDTRDRKVRSVKMAGIDEAAFNRLQGEARRVRKSNPSELTKQRDVGFEDLRAAAQRKARNGR